LGREAGLKMNFAFVKLRGVKQSDGSYLYHSLIQRDQRSQGLIRTDGKTFKSENEMLTIMDGILRHQVNGKDRDIRNVLDKIQREIGYEYFNLDLTSEEAASLGWPHAF
jgi:hypothetical protein